MVNAYSAHVLLIDGAHTLRRSMYQPGLRELSSSTGVPSGAVYGFLNSVKSAINNLQASSIVVCWEGGHSERRKQVYGEYKQRDYDDSAPPELDPHGMTDYEYYKHQMQWIEKILETLGITQLRVQGKEGDDVLFQASRLLRGQKTVISEDRDFFALISPEISVFRPVKKELVTHDNFKAITGMPTPKHYLWEKILLGDGSDNIPGIAKGVGGKTVQDVLLRIDNPDDITIPRIIQEAATFGKARYDKIVQAGEAPIRRNWDLIDIERETFDTMELLQVCDTMEQQKYPNVDMATKIMQALEFNPDNIGYLVSRLSRMADFPLANLLDKDFVIRKMLNQTSALQG